MHDSQFSFRHSHGLQTPTCSGLRAITLQNTRGKAGIAVTGTRAASDWTIEPSPVFPPDSWGGFDGTWGDL